MIRPIMFSAPMVRALLEGRKTQTRRLAWKRESEKAFVLRGEGPSPWQRVQPGDRLWVREAFHSDDGHPPVKFMADHPGDARGLGWRPSIHMPRAFSRLTLTVTDVRVQRLQDISEEDARAEGIRPLPQQSAGDPSAWWESAPGQHQARTPRHAFRLLWNSLHGPMAWEANPEVVALSFTVAQRNIDA